MSNILYWIFKITSVSRSQRLTTETLWCVVQRLHIKDIKMRNQSTLISLYHLMQTQWLLITTFKVSFSGNEIHISTLWSSYITVVSSPKSRLPKRYKEIIHIFLMAWEMDIPSQVDSFCSKTQQSLDLEEKITWSLSFHHTNNIGKISSPSTPVVPKREWVWWLTEENAKPHTTGSIASLRTIVITVRSKKGTNTVIKKTDK